ncbi:MAG: class I SAM-dependent methyltransferase [Nitrospiraceae bacterium]|nr:class I SAM-dependent methyltransferase [Nitrospiraceae bacterium]
MKCRHCGAEPRLPFLDLGSAPPSNAFLTDEQLRAPETYYPLRLVVCEDCWLVQTEDYVGRESMFNDQYGYFSSYSTSWLAHARNYVDSTCRRFGVGSDSCLVEVGANDGYLLQYVAKAGIPCYGIEPTDGTAHEARRKGIEIIGSFFGTALAEELAAVHRQADVMVANNVLAHVPDINDFVAGFVSLLKLHGVATFEFPHLLNMVRHNQFDTAYHEHFSYLSLTSVERIFRCNGLAVFDVEEIPTQGGSLRVYAQRADRGRRPREASVDELLRREDDAGMRCQDFYTGFQVRAENLKNDLLTFLRDAKSDGKRVAAYGAAAKGNTLLNFAGVRSDLLSYVVDKNPAKQRKFMPGSHIPILSPAALRERRPDYLLILPWNIADEVKEEYADLAEYRVRFVTAVPQLEVT